MPERFFIPKPTATDNAIRVGEKFGIYINDRQQPLQWSADFPLPEIGSRIFIAMNSIGWAKVMGYLESDHFLGVMTKATKPPVWLRKQLSRDRKEARSSAKPHPQWMLDGIGCEFGNELRLKRPPVEAYRGRIKGNKDEE